MPNKYSSNYLLLSDKDKAEILSFYLEPNSKIKTINKFNITVYALDKILKDNSCKRDRYGEIRNELVSTNIKLAIKNNPSIVENRVKAHIGSKRSSESKEKMRNSAWIRMSNQKNKFVSIIETKFAEYLKNKVGLSYIPQFRVKNKPFDFLFDNNVLVEFDGIHHYDENYYMWKNNPDGFKRQQNRDELRKEIAKNAGYKLIIIKQSQVDKNGKLLGDGLVKFMNDIGYSA